jgi:hypothetical protein
LLLGVFLDLLEYGIVVAMLNQLFAFQGNRYSSTSMTVGCPPFSAAGVEATSRVFTGLPACLSFTAVVALTFFRFFLS